MALVREKTCVLLKNLCATLISFIFIFLKFAQCQRVHLYVSLQDISSNNMILLTIETRIIPLKDISFSCYQNRFICPDVVFC